MAICVLHTRIPSPQQGLPLNQTSSVRQHSRYCERKGKCLSSLAYSKEALPGSLNFWALPLPPPPQKKKPYLLTVKTARSTQGRPQKNYRLLHISAQDAVLC